MSTNIYVGNISFKAVEDDLADLFAQYGNVSSARIITDRETGRSKGFGFVEMEEGKDASEAIAALNGKNWFDRELRVNEARERR